MPEYMKVKNAKQIDDLEYLVKCPICGEEKLCRTEDLKYWVKVRCDNGCYDQAHILIRPKGCEYEVH